MLDIFEPVGAFALSSHGSIVGRLDSIGTGDAGLGSVISGVGQGDDGSDDGESHLF